MDFGDYPGATGTDTKDSGFYQEHRAVWFFIFRNIQKNIFSFKKNRQEFFKKLFPEPGITNSRFFLFRKNPVQEFFVQFFLIKK
ncbi:MAG: hypothetical protein CVV30_03220 [Methanomicrobiales archaeon HGW-Methanomicrobiales-1]|nr:MAG: hypothetical protein CVV30_03220 [Methanomicrobiales archaeon HGW-Methanomicrobiales-1]